MPIRQNLSALALAGAAFCGRRAAASGAALLVFATLLLAAPTPSAASSYTLNFTGWVASTTLSGTDDMEGGVFAALGIVGGDPVSGALTFAPLSESPDFMSPAGNIFNQASAAFTFHVSHPGGNTVNVVESGSGLVNALASGSFSDLVLGATVASSNLQLTFSTLAVSAPLASLAGLPTSPSALIALLGGGFSAAFGNYDLAGFGRVSFGIAYNLNTTPIPTATIATTPIPAALPLFASALTGLGFFGWRRKKARAA
jgi:hypothetical protein